MPVSRRLPPLNALRAFEATARNGSLTRAAQELSVTQGAVSRHLRQLEEWLGVPLCTRLRRGVETTPEGTAFAAVLRAAFDQIEAQTRRILERPAENKLRIKLPPTFAIRWFVPRLARFHGLNRHVDVQITTSHQVVDFDREEIDLCIHSGPSPLPGVYCRRLFGEIIFPVCSPGLLRSASPPRTPGELGRYVLLCSMHRPDDWPAWLRAAGETAVDGNKGLKFENSALAYQAAIDELGIVMAQRAFVEDDLRTGRLIAPLPLKVRTPNGYYLAYPRARRSAPLIRAFEDWIVRETAAMEEAAPAGEGPGEGPAADDWRAGGALRRTDGGGLRQPVPQRAGGAARRVEVEGRLRRAVEQDPGAAEGRLREGARGERPRVEVDGDGAGEQRGRARAGDPDDGTGVAEGGDRRALRRPRPAQAGLQPLRRRGGDPQPLRPHHEDGGFAGGDGAARVRGKAEARQCDELRRHAGEGLRPGGELHEVAARDLLEPQGLAADERRCAGEGGADGVRHGGARRRGR
ncbi:MAG: transcriptional regulator GcvA [Rhodospirillaceae bacterium]|nr:transcriptional regulator GcvA [Rhodospirillaceae bacterium]